MKKILLFITIIFSTHTQALEFQGKFLQGHFILGKAKIGSKVFIDKKQVKVSKDGYFVFGIDRDRKFDLTITKIQNGIKEKVIKKVLKRKYNIQRIDGLPPKQVTPPPEVIERIKKDNTKKPRLVYPNREIRSMIFASLPLYLSKIGNKGKMLRKKTRMYATIPPDDVKPKVGITFHAT